MKRDMKPALRSDMKKSAIRTVPWVAVAVLVAAAAGCGTTGAISGTSGAGAQARPGPAPARVATEASSPSLSVAEREAHNLGLVPGSLKMSVTLTLRSRDQPGLNALLATGGRVTPAEWAASYGPSPARVAAARRALARGGIASTWSPGDVSLTVTAPAGRLERFFRVDVDRFVPRSGPAFYAPTGALPVPSSLAGDVVAITGMDNYQRDLTEAIASANGVTPGQMTSFYDISPLRSAGLDGSGETVIFPEWAMPPASVLEAFAAKFNLPPFNVSVVSNAAAWGAPATSSTQGYYDLAGEAALDLEVVHGMAPGAREIVYETPNPAALPNMLKAIVGAHPGAILSSSISMHACEQETNAKQDAVAEDAVFAQGAAEGMSIFWASGDRGVFACLPDGSSSTALDISVQPDASSPHLTCVGGTFVFLSSSGAYFKETAWGEPIEQWGGGGGVSTFFTRPSWQQAPGVGTITGRGEPDVSANADIESGWDVFEPSQNGPQEGAVGGTSAATPFWAAVTALIDQDLAQQHLKTIGFANPALYFFANSPKGLPAAPFHAITQGSNLHFPATTGWNQATGLGSPDVAHLADDFAWYASTHPAGS
jgi:subtilase family serine protease